MWYSDRITIYYSQVLRTLYYSSFGIEYCEKKGKVSFGLEQKSYLTNESYGCVNNTDRVSWYMLEPCFTKAPLILALILQIYFQAEFRGCTLLSSRLLRDERRSVYMRWKRQALKLRVLFVQCSWFELIKASKQETGAVNQTRPANFARIAMRFLLKYSLILTFNEYRRNPVIYHVFRFIKRLKFERSM